MLEKEKKVEIKDWLALLHEREVSRILIEKCDLLEKEILQIKKNYTFCQKWKEALRKENYELKTMVEKLRKENLELKNIAYSNN